MGRQGTIGDLFRRQLRLERERRGWTQMHLANLLTDKYAILTYAQTIGKIEAGDRAVTLDELFALSLIFGMSTDAMMGRTPAGTDVLWAASKLSSNAQKMIGEVEHLQSKLFNDVQDLGTYGSRDQQPMTHMHDAAHRASLALQGAADALAAVAGEFPIPGGIAS